jgi:hypothetical protein
MALRAAIAGVRNSSIVQAAKPATVTDSNARNARGRMQP